MSASAPPSWLFSNNFTKTNDTTSAATTPQQDKMVKKEKKSEKKAKAVAAPTQQAPPDQLMDLVDSFLSENAFTSAHEAFQKQRAQGGWKPSKKQTSRPNLVTVFQTWQTSLDGKPVAAKVDVKAVKAVSSDSDSSSSDSDSDSSSDEEDVDMADAAADSDSSSSSSSSSDSDSSSDSESEDEKPAPKNALKRKAPESDSSSSANGKEKKVPNKPFSRIPDEVYVNPKFASNEYVPNDYSQRAHEDLIVTKGKGFTKEKNKKKRGSYRGGLIDISEKKGIKFEF
ncbi:lisH domain-containing protein C1711.05 [Colletotrichum liriopes]|uniref:LisH domain-containing protein C1711.05 n=1 Tax=Colletotrichum liriopes TaxID=708192 RepID=A0AA37LZP7_9PEZI|nr:lisH domain-containing protein C1711.05 [Colletotrichum liriopes]